MYMTVGRLLIISALIAVASLANISPVIVPAFAQQNTGPPPGTPPGAPAPILGVGWPALALAGAALAGYRLRQRKRSKSANEGAAEMPLGEN